VKWALLSCHFWPTGNVVFISLALCAAGIRRLAYSIFLATKAWRRNGGGVMMAIRCRQYFAAGGWRQLVA